MNICGTDHITVTDTFKSKLRPVCYITTNYPHLVIQVQSIIEKKCPRGELKSEYKKNSTQNLHLTSIFFFWLYLEYW